MPLFGPMPPRKLSAQMGPEASLDKELIFLIKTHVFLRPSFWEGLIEILFEKSSF
jgi:hypothetical protein